MRTAGLDHRFGQVGADSSAWDLDFADESAPANSTKMEPRSKPAETMIKAVLLKDGCW